MLLEKIIAVMSDVTDIGKNQLFWKVPRPSLKENSSIIPVKIFVQNSFGSSLDIRGKQCKELFFVISGIFVRGYITIQIEKHLKNARD